MSEKLHFPQDGMLAGLLLYFTMHDGSITITMLCKQRSNSYIYPMFLLDKLTFMIHISMHVLQFYVK